MKTLPFIIIVADRGRMTTYRRQEDGSLKVIESLEIKETSEKLTDKAGAFPNSGTQGHGNSTAEKMSFAAELEMRSFRQIAQKITEHCTTNHPDSWGFAAPAEINGAILDGLAAEWKNRLAVNLPLDLIHASTIEVAQRFANQAIPVS